MLERLDGRHDSSVIVSIKRNLNHVFMTRQGGALIRVDDYGVPDFNQYNSRFQAVPEIRKMIEKNIKEFEPRLKNVRVSYNQNDNSNALILNFLISAYLGKDNVQMTIVMTETGRIRVKG